jgi:murein DD-endopeptidase MepM/ murein hydrolase activator NlpD
MFRPHFGFARHQADAANHPDEGAPPQGGAGKIAALCTIVLLAAWAGSATLYILFRDDALKSIIARQISITRSYETQASQLQAEIDRLRSLKLIDQERVERALAEIVRRQNALEARQSALTALGAAKPTNGETMPEITGAVASPATPPSTSPPRPTPLSDTILIVPPGDRTAQLESRPLPPLAGRTDFSQIESATDVRVGAFARELAQLEAAQSRLLNRTEEIYDGRERRMRKVFADLGLKAARSAGAAEARAGGPFLPWTRPPEDPFVRQLHRIRLSARAVEALQREIDTVPVSRPTTGAADVTSPFGVRLDPFVRQLALHTGVDFRGEPGEPVRAAASGKVVQAERNGGYGLMVEMDHGNGIATRYAHLSAISVSEGAVVEVGTVLGRIGTTGRSTGPHLHYEVRLNGEPVDPQRFLRAGLRLQPAP